MPKLFLTFSKSRTTKLEQNHHKKSIFQWSHFVNRCNLISKTYISPNRPYHMVLIYRYFLHSNWRHGRSIAGHILFWEISIFALGHFQSWKNGIRNYLSYRLQSNPHGRRIRCPLPQHNATVCILRHRLHLHLPFFQSTFQLPSCNLLTKL